ncbi:MAG: hypothetical protein JWM14_1488 [Chitinophagaceae bacterium]|nr:hypothetical protein [Chitinophagaceae bacterium]
MIKKINLVLLCLLLSISQTFACMQENRVSLDGTISFSMGRDFKNENYWKKDFGSVNHLHWLDSLWKTNKSIEDYNDYGVQLAYLKRYKKALAVFQHIEQMKPGLYNTMANMGTTYELLGQDKLALEWIKKAVAKNPDSHYGSEWFHVKILEAKIKGPSSWNSIFLIGTDFGTDSIPKSNLSKKELNKLTEAMFRQLIERMKFIKPKDEMMALLLLFEYGNIAALAEDATSSYRIYKIAKEYGASGELFNKRYAFAEKLQEKINVYEHKLDQKRTQQARTTQIKKELSKDYTSYLIISLCFIIILSTGAFLWFKYRKQN